MYPKRDLERLNVRRAANARIRFARKRMLETVIELSFARGKCAQLPTPMRVPPEWALNAARLVSERWLAPLIKITPEEIRSNPRGVVKELLGIFDAMVASMAALADELPPAIRRTKEGRTVKEIADELAAGDFRSYLVSLERELGHKLPKPTHRELVEHAQRYERGLTELISPEDEFGVTGMETMTAQLYYLVWFYWPKLVLRKQLRATDLEAFLFQETQLRFSTKLVEKIYRDTRIAATWRAT